MASTIEDLVTGVTTYVKAQIGAYLTSIEQTKEDGVQTDDFRFFKYGYRDPFMLNTLPACFSYHEEGAAEPLTVGSDTIAVKLWFCIVLAGSNAEDIALAALRYIEAFRQLLVAHPTCGGACDGLGDRVEWREVPAVGEVLQKHVILFGATFLKDVNR